VPKKVFHPEHGSGEVVTYRRYDDSRDIAVLLRYSLFESASYRPWRAFVSWRGLFEYLAGDDSWGTMTRSGFDDGSRRDSRTRDGNP
jgi:hypothetical protein